MGEEVGVERHVGAGAGGYFAPHIRAYIRRSGAPNHIGAMVAVKDRLNGAKNPLAHLHQPDITLEKVMASPMLWDPVRYDETCPSSDGAAAMVIGNEEIAEKAIGEGARYYIRKPFKISEMQARVKHTIEFTDTANQRDPERLEGRIVVVSRPVRWDICRVAR